MAIKRYIATTDTTIANSYQANLSTTASGSNMGAADVTEVFSIYGQVSSSTSGNSLEASRALYYFDVADITTDRTNGDIPKSGSVDFVLKLTNAEHHKTTPQNYDMRVIAVSESWTEGSGLDLDNYRDIGECNWNYRTSANAWGNGNAAAKGGVFHTGSVEAWSNEIQFKQAFGEDVTEDLEIVITPLVEHWIAGTVSNNGIGVLLSGSYEDGTSLRSYYTKKFFARNSEYFFKRPRIEARWDSSKKDDRANFYASSSLGDTENTNTIYLYNNLRGQLTNIPGLHARNTLVVKLYRDALTDSAPVEVTGGLTSDTGIYTASLAMDTSASVLYDVWSTGSIQFYTGSITVKSFAATAENPNSTYNTSIVNLKPSNC